MTHHDQIDPKTTTIIPAEPGWTIERDYGTDETPDVHHEKIVGWAMCIVDGFVHAHPLTAWGSSHMRGIIRFNGEEQ